MTAAWLQTLTGKRFELEAPTPDMVCLQDVAHALSQQPRFMGHTSRPYSVALHSILVSEHVPLRDALWGLLHDAHEAYVCDIPRPMKPLIPEYRVLEERVQKVVLERFGLSLPQPASVKPIDIMLSCAEAKALLPAAQRLYESWTDWQEPPVCVLSAITDITYGPSAPLDAYGLFRTALLSLTYGEEPSFRLCSCARPT